MSITCYSEYKKSLDPWLGDIPSHWGCEPLKYSTEIYTGNSLNEAEKKEYESIDTNHIPYVSSKDLDLRKRKFNYENGLRVPADKNIFKVAPKNSFLLCIEGGSAGKKIAYLDQDVCFVNKLCCFKDKKDSRFKYYFAQSKYFKNRFDISMTGLIGGVSTSVLKNFPIPVPPNEEQILIVKFLDHETTKIDTLVNEQEKLIELLNEKRQAVISQAVTNGLDSKVKMKDSGVEWLGNVPEHWEVMTLRRCSSNVQTGGTPSSDSINNEGEDGLDWYTPGDFTDTLTLGRSTKKISTSLIESSGIKIFPSNSVLIISIGGTLGKVGYLNQAASSNQQINAVIPNQKINGYFLAYSLAIKTEQMKYLSNASTIGIMNQEKTKEIWVAVPPLEEQFNITNYLDGITKSIDTLINTCLATITLLNERRSALISAAVTGQIDVRNYQPKEVA
jgi:type I restriction enzyme S subunit